MISFALDRVDWWQYRFLFFFSFNFTSKNYKGTFLFQQFQQFTLGISSLSKLGPVGAAIEVAVILYLAVTSAIGLYTLPGVRIVQPRFRSTPLTHLIANCALLLVLSSALPLLSRILGKALGFFYLDSLGYFYLDSAQECFNSYFIISEIMESW